MVGNVNVSRNGSMCFAAVRELPDYERWRLLVREIVLITTNNMCGCGELMRVGER